MTWRRELGAMDSLLKSCGRIFGRQLVARVGTPYGDFTKYKGWLISIFYATRFGFDAIGALPAEVISAPGTFMAESAALSGAMGVVRFFTRMEGKGTVA